MKQTVYGAVLAIIFMLILACNMAVSGRSVRQNELNQALNQAVEQAAGELVAEDGMDTPSEEELAADLAEGILTRIESNGDIQVDIFACDAQRGLLSVRATAHFKHVNGKMGTVSAVRTVVLEQYAV